MRIMKQNLLAIIAILFTGTAVFAGECPSSHCSGMNKQINEICKADGKAGQKVYVPYNDSFCYCGCSCYAAGTEILGSGSIDTVDELALGESLETLVGPVEITKVFKDQVENTAAVAIVIETGRQLTVSPNHPFVTQGGVVKSAASLSQSDFLLNEAGEPVAIASITPTKYTGTFYNVILNGKKESGEDRIVIAEGVQSGDWEVQSFRDYLNANVGLREIIAEMNK